MKFFCNAAQDSYYRSMCTIGLIDKFFIYFHLGGGEGDIL